MSLDTINFINKTYTCGTVRKDRKGLPDDFNNDKNMSRGDYDWRSTAKSIIAMKWMAKKGIYFLSNYHDPEALTSVNRRQKDGTLQEISCPKLVEDNNKHMRYVDKADMSKSCYELDRKSRRWWLQIFWHFVDVTVVNSFI
ncbi:DDE Tnp 1 7 domain containing protein, partial [Asbolus verrucosus]